MKKINFAVALSLLCCSYDSMGFRSRLLQTTNGIISSTQQNTNNRNTQIAQQTYPSYVYPTPNTDRLAGVNLDAVVVKESMCRDLDLNDAKFALFEVKDRNCQNPGGNSCGYNALHTTRLDVYNALKSLYRDKWDKLTKFEQKSLKTLMYNVITLDFDCECSFLDKYTRNNWSALDDILKPKVLSGQAVLGDNLGGLICYIRGENLRIFQSSNIAICQGYKFDGSWPIRYLWNVGRVNLSACIGGVHWQELRPYDIDAAIANDLEYILMYVFQP